MYHWEDGPPDPEIGDSKFRSQNQLLYDHRSGSTVRARAHETLNELKEVMSSTIIIEHDAESLATSLNPRNLVYEGVYSSPKRGVNREASLRLRELLSSQSAPIQIPSLAAVHTTQSTEKIDHFITTETLPTPHEAKLIVQSHARHTQQLEAENHYLKEELQSMKGKMLELLEENECLHQELRNSVLHEILQESSPSKVGESGRNLTGEVFEQVASQNVMTKWKTELARLHELHDAKSSHLESQLASTKSELLRYERIVDDLKSRLRIHDSDIATREDGSCDLMTDAQRDAHQRIVTRLQQERDELLEAVTSLRGRVRESGQREDEAYHQVKTSIQLVEQAQLEQTEALVAKEQLQSQLEKTQERFTQHTNEMAARMEAEKEGVRGENRTIMAQLTDKIREITELQAATQQRLEKALRDRKCVMKELDSCKGEIKVMRRETSQMAASQRTENTTCTIIRQQSVQDVERLRGELSQANKHIDQERSRLRTEKSELHRRLEQAERELVNSKEECIHTTSQIHSLERELHFAKMTKESVEMCRKKDLEASSRLTQQRETELNAVIDELHDKHEKVEGEMDSIVRKQNKLIMKMRDECHIQTKQLAKLTHKYRTEVGSTRKENDILREKLERYIKRSDDCENLNSQHTKVQVKMRERLKGMDEHGQKQAQQVLDLLNKQGEMIRERQMLAKEVQLLRSKLLSYPDDEVLSDNRPVAVSLAAIDDILNSVRKHEANVIKEQYKPVDRPVVKMDSLSIDDLM